MSLKILSWELPLYRLCDPKLHLGTYNVSVIHINYEYAVLSQGGTTSSTTLIDVKGNIDGGYGIFTGISCVTKSVKVSQGSSPF